MAPRPFQSLGYAEFSGYLALMPLLPRLPPSHNPIQLIINNLLKALTLSPKIIVISVLPINEVLCLEELPVSKSLHETHIFNFLGFVPRSFSRLRKTILVANKDQKGQVWSWLNVF